MGKDHNIKKKIDGVVKYKKFGADKTKAEVISK